MSYFFNEGISFLRDFEKNLRGVADSAAEMIEKKENPDCDFRMAKKTALNMIDGIRVATDSVELVHFQSQKDRPNREAQEMDAEFKRDMVEKRRIRDAKKEKEPDNNRVIPDPMCCLCFTPFTEGDRYFGFGQQRGCYEPGVAMCEGPRCERCQRHLSDEERAK